MLKKEQIDVTNELDKYENVIKENQQRIKHWKKEVWIIFNYKSNNYKYNNSIISLSFGRWIVYWHGFTFSVVQVKLHEIEGDEHPELEVFEKERLLEVDKEEEQYTITVLEEKKAQMKPNMAAIQEYKKKVINLWFSFRRNWHTEYIFQILPFGRNIYSIKIVTCFCYLLLGRGLFEKSGRTWPHYGIKRCPT